MSTTVTAAADREAVSGLIDAFRVEAEQALAGINQRLKETGGPEALAKIIGAFYLLLEESGQRVVRLHTGVARARGMFPNDARLVETQKRVVAQFTVWAALAEGFSWYVRDLSRFSHIHGSIAAVVVFLIWIYISAVLLLYGVEVTAANARLRRHRPEQIPAAPSPRV